MLLINKAAYMYGIQEENIFIFRICIFSQSATLRLITHQHVNVLEHVKAPAELVID